MKERILLVTGSSRGLGRALTEDFLARGDTVVGCSRKASSLSHPNYSHYELDIADPAAVGGLFRTLRKDLGLLDAVINNAGVASMNAFALTPDSSYEAIFNTNVRGTLMCCQKALPLLRRAKHPRIVNFSTVAVPLRLQGEALYAASKSAVETLTRVIAKEYGGQGITCNAVGPSPIATALIQGVPKHKIDQLVQEQAIPHMATEDDVINAVNFFLRPESRMITGQVIYLGGAG